ncbi:uncharacterized protein LOC108625106 [Ceratina calcarata]|uniref:Uncharacterized protein LOC108625106 n=1 Tax=Ceratina calcarata TaxID=156304 RepID=A0AAJ7N6Q7_9HYME|nr:uncharacterized protein LOC108625106 [Ceratina calcarata]
MSRSGPAIRLTLCVPEESEIRINLEFVIAFKINPIRSFITNVSWFEKYPGIPWLAAPIVSDDTSSDLQDSWRLDFLLHEKEILSHTYSRLRPIIKQMKMLRNTQKWTCLKNYFIDTIFLNNLEELGKDLNEQSKTSMFFKMLKTLREVCEQCKIDYFWKPSINLMEGSDPSEMMTIANRIGDIIQDIENNIKTQSFILAKYILTGDELKTLADKSRLHGHKYSGVNLQDLYKITKQDDM